MTNLIDALESFLKAQQFLSHSLRVAYSGGRDSHVLLHALTQLRHQYPTLQLSAVHIHHGLQSDADGWAAHCAQICQMYQVPFQTIALQLKIPRGESVEEFARKHRYRALRQLLQPKQAILTAHTMDDQAETFLLQLLRGGGPKGLAGIAAVKPLGQGSLWRPLLGVNRQAIEAYAREQKLCPIEDKSNADRRFRRNFLRHEVFPLLQQTYPGFVACIARSSQHCANSQQLLQEYLQQDYQQLVGPQKHILNLDRLKIFSVIKQQQLLRHWFDDNAVPAPSSIKLQEILQQMCQAKPGANPCVSWADVEVRRHQGALYLLPLMQPVVTAKKWWDFSDIYQSSDGNRWQAVLVQGQGIAIDKLTSSGLQVAYRQGGERCRLPGRQGSRALKKLFQERGIMEWQRGQLPLFYQEDSLVGVGDLFICQEWIVEGPQDYGWLIQKK